MSPEKPAFEELRIDRGAESNNGSRWSWVGWLCLALLALGGAGVWGARSRVPEVRAFTVRAPEASGPRTLLNASGYVMARREATVSSKVTGKVVEVLIEEGKKVEAGEVLARLDDTNLKASLALADAQVVSARASLAETRARLEVAVKEQQRLVELAGVKVVSASQLDQAQAEANALQARLEQQAAQVTVAEREVALWRQQLEDTVIRAPFPGMVTAKNAQPGEMISPISAGGGYTRTGICTIVDMNSLEIEVEVNESYINRVQPRQPVEAILDAYPDWRIPARVIAIIPTADRQKATVKVRVGFEQLDARMLPQMGIKVAFRAAAEQAPARPLVTIPKNACEKLEGRDTVWVLGVDGRVARRRVAVAETQGNDVWVAEGLKAGERVVLKGPKTLTEGAKVREAQR